MSASNQAPNQQNRLKLQIATYVLGRAVSGTGDWIYIVALNILVLNRTGSALAVAALWTIPYIAHFVVGGWSGSIADRANQRLVLITTDIVRAIVIGAIPFTSSIWFIYALIFLENSAGVFFGQASLPYITRLVPDIWRKRVNGIVGSIRSGALLVGPAIAGALMWIGSASFAIWADAGSFLVSALTLFILPNLRSSDLQSVDEAQSGRSDAPRVKVLLRRLQRDWSESLHFLSRQRLLLTVLVTVNLTTVLAESANAIEVVFAKQALHLGKVGYSTMVLFAGIGVLAGSIVVTAFVHKLSTRLLLVIGLILTNITYLLYACTIGLWTAAGTLVMLGLCNAAMSVGLQTYLQAAIPTERMGRLMGTVAPPVSVLTILCIGLTGWVAGPVPVRTIMLILTASSSTIALVGGWFMLRPNHRLEFQVPGESMEAL